MKKTLYSLMLNEEVVREIDALAHGATDFVPKPYRPAVIRSSPNM